MKYSRHLLAGMLFFSAFAAAAARAQLAMPAARNADIETMVRNAFPDAPEMAEIAKCESGLRQYRSDGSVLRGGSGGRYIGVFQISEGHLPAARSMGLDIQTAEGNIAFAKHLFGRQGTAPWAPCVKTPARAAPVSFPTTASLPDAQLTINLRLGMAGSQVLVLQKLLNASGFAVASAGPGSPGNETQTFGSLTQMAVRKFQCSKGIVCEGSESSTGYNSVGPRTRAALQNLGP